MNQYAKASAPAGAVVCDLRSDTVTRPDAAMRAAMAAAEVGDDVMGDDPTVARLEATLAERLGKEAGLFLPSGTQSNLAAMLSHCGRGEEVITGRGYHVFKYEVGGASALGGIVMDPLAVVADGGLEPAAIAGAVKEDDSHHPVSRLLSLENTHNGKAVSLARIEAAVAAGRAAGLAVHLDGARLFNAATALGCAAEEVTERRLIRCRSACPKVWGRRWGRFCLGPAAFIARARRWRKMLGGGLRQVGVLAAAGLHALEHNVAGLASDHARAEALAGTLPRPERRCGRAEQQYGFLYAADRAVNAALGTHLAAQGVMIAAGEAGPIRMVLHRDVTDEALAAVQNGLSGFYS